MKKGRIILTVFLVLLIVFGWFGKAKTGVKNIKKYNDFVNMAKEYSDDRLYQKSIRAFDNALKIKDSYSLRDEWVKTYGLAYEDGVVSKNDYINAMYEACSKYEKKTELWETLIDFCVYNKDYSNAYSYYTKSVNAKAKSEKLSELRDEIVYSYTVKNRIFNKAIRSTNGFYTLFDGMHWGVMTPSGDWKYECDYDYISPVAGSLEVLITTRSGLRVLDYSNVVQSIIDSDINIDNSKAVSEGRALMYNDGYEFYDYNSKEFVLQKYEDASIFTNGIAAVEENSKWHLIDTEGKAVNSTEYDDIKLYDNGEYLYDGLMLASVNGKYALYTQKGEKKYDIPGVNADKYFGQPVAFQDENGKWGFADKGNIIIEPQFDEAKSFCSNVAAVRSGDTWGYINKNGKLIIDYQFVDAGYFTSDGVCFVSLVNGEYFEIELRFKNVQ